MVSTQRRRLVTHDVASRFAHDVRSPLAALSINVEYALAELENVPACERVREALVDCRAAGVRLARGVANLVDVSRGEHGVIEPNVTDVDLAGLLRAVAQTCWAEAQSRSIVLAVDCFPGTVAADHDLLLRAFETLVLSLLRCAPKHSTIEIVGEQRADAVVASVRVEALQGYAAGSCAEHLEAAVHLCGLAAAAHGGWMAGPSSPLLEGQAWEARMILPPRLSV